jgi:hypothetical protein
MLKPKTKVLLGCLGAATALGAALVIAAAAQPRASGQASAPAGVINVDSDQALAAALVPGNAGKTIVVAPGEYGTLTVISTVFDPAITISGREGSAAPHFAGVLLRGGCAGINVRGLKITQVPADTGYNHASVVIDTCQHISIAANEITSTNPNDGLLAVYVAGGRFDFGAKYIEIANNVMHDVGGGVQVQRGDHFNVHHNQFKDIYINDFMAMFSVEDVVFDSNYETNAHAGGGVHFDTVQIRNGERPPRNIQITNNTYYRGEGAPAQGPFAGDDGYKSFFGGKTVAGSTTLTATDCDENDNTGAPYYNGIRCAHHPIAVGQFVFGPGIPPGARIVPGGSGKGTTGTYTLSAPATATGSGWFASAEYPPTNVTIDGNKIYGAQNNGIAIGDGLNVKITNNVVQAWSDLPSTISANGSMLTLSNNTFTRANPDPPSGLYIDNGSNAATNTIGGNTGVAACRRPCAPP